MQLVWFHLQVIAVVGVSMWCCCALVAFGKRLFDAVRPLLAKNSAGALFESAKSLPRVSLIGTRESPTRGRICRVSANLLNNEIPSFHE